MEILFERSIRQGGERSQLLLPAKLSLRRKIMDHERTFKCFVHFVELDLQYERSQSKAGPTRLGHGGLIATTLSLIHI